VAVCCVLQHHCTLHLQQEDAGSALFRREMCHLLGT
jgi:hypothetical protein